MNFLTGALWGVMFKLALFGHQAQMHTQLASWYYDGGRTACGFHARYGVANKRLRCGTRVLFRYRGRSAWAVVQDRGPYVGGRVWDLNQGLATALRFSGVNYVQASRVG